VTALLKIGETLAYNTYSIKSILTEDYIIKVPKVTKRKGFNDLIYET
jgi:hypothetical protein